MSFIVCCFSEERREAADCQPIRASDQIKSSDWTTISSSSNLAKLFLLFFTHDWMTGRDPAPLWLANMVAVRSDWPTGQRGGTGGIVGSSQSPLGQKSDPGPD